MKTPEIVIEIHTPGIVMQGRGFTFSEAALALWEEIAATRGETLDGLDERDRAAVTFHLGHILAGGRKFDEEWEKYGPDGPLPSPLGIES